MVCKGSAGARAGLPTTEPAVALTRCLTQRGEAGSVGSLPRAPLHVQWGQRDSQQSRTCVCYACCHAGQGLAQGAGVQPRVSHGGACMCMIQGCGGTSMSMACKCVCTGGEVCVCTCVCRMNTHARCFPVLSFQLLRLENAAGARLIPAISSAVPVVPPSVPAGTSVPGQGAAASLAPGALDIPMPVEEAICQGSKPWQRITAGEGPPWSQPAGSAN